MLTLNYYLTRFEALNGDLDSQLRFTFETMVDKYPQFRDVRSFMISKEQPVRICIVELA